MRVRHASKIGRMGVRPAMARGGIYKAKLHAHAAPDLAA